MHLTVTSRKVPARVISSPVFLLYAFASLIVVGTLLLLLPFTRHEGGFTPFMDAFFTAASAVTLTGLVVQDTSTYWTRIGQVIILGLIFVGGLGFMTIATFLLVLISQRVAPTQGLLAKGNLGVNRLGGLLHLAIGVALTAAAIQVVGFAVLVLRFYSLYPLAEAVWQAAFHSVSSFNNAGFVVLTEPDGLAHFRGDELVLIPMVVLIFLGGTGYAVMADVVKSRKFSLFRMNTKLVLSLSALLLVVGTLAFLALEYQNPATLGTLGVEGKILNSAVQSASSRTAGFNTVDFGATREPTNFFLSSLMFVGGASGSVAGGIKVNTLAVVMIALISMIRGRSQASAFGREIPQEQVQIGMVVIGIFITFVFLIALSLTFLEQELHLIDLFFESVSAFGTVGFSTGLTSDLSHWSRLVLIIAMFLGKFGTVALGLALVQRSAGEAFRYAQERVTIG